MRRLLLTLSLWLLVLAGPAAAHLLPAGNGKVRLDADGVFSLVAVPVAALSGVDDDGNGRLSLAELNRHRPAIAQQVAALLQFSGDGAPATLAFQDLLIPHLHDPSAPPDTDYLVAMQRHRWAVLPQAITLHATQFARVPAPLLLLATREGESESVLLTPGYATHHFFAGPLAVAGRFMLLGAEHILGGLDHLLFLLTVLVAGAGCRHWLAVITSFTAAHSITLTLSVLGWVAMAPAVVEPLIAASIALLAWDNLRRRNVSLARRSAIVFACGLLHGLGFASALAGIGGPASRWLQLGAFNLGVELGQLVFVAAALLALAALRRWLPQASPDRLMRVTSWGAAGMAAVLLTQLLAA